MRILIVEDMEDVREVIRRGLEESGYDDVVEASSGTEALSRMDGVQLILTDLYMPGMGGHSFVKAIRDDPRYRNIPIIAVTGESQLSMVAELLRSGVNDYVVKPFSLPDLIAKVHQYKPTLDQWFAAGGPPERDGDPDGDE
ncbi:MAG: Chemotaxis protein CheY [Calditrichaeota bacterium]|nr:Chemotaxis protein CheY [Calditrichota bacterium]